MAGPGFDITVPALFAPGAAAALLLIAWMWPSPPSPVELARPPPAKAVRGAPTLLPHGPRFEAPQSPVATEPTKAISAEREIAVLGRGPTRAVSTMRERYLSTRDLHALMEELLPAAATGERESQYHLYLILSRCQTYLRMDAEAARALNEQTLLSMNELPAEVREQVQSEYWRCRGFAGANLDPLRAAMGADTPGAEVEYASIWFQRALEAGYPPALTEAALRINLLSESQRVGLLEEAVVARDPDVYWQLFLASPGGSGEPISVGGLAWLILACRRGQDCSSDAEWFRVADCLEADTQCAPAESAIEHYWYGTGELEREAAMAMANRIEQRLASGQAVGLPWPDLAKRNIYVNRFDRDSGG